MGLEDFNEGLEAKGPINRVEGFLLQKMPYVTLMEDTRRHSRDGILQVVSVQEDKVTLEFTNDLGSKLEKTYDKEQVPEGLKPGKAIKIQMFPR